MKRANFSDLIGQTIVNIDADKASDVIYIETTDRRYRMQHDQDCCESVLIEDINGDPADLVGKVVRLAEESLPDNPPPEYVFADDSYTLTFYRLRVDGGDSLDIRWFGTSNGYYSESVDFELAAVKVDGEWVAP